MPVSPEMIEELKAQLEFNNEVKIVLEGSDNVELEITDVQYTENVILVTTEAIHTA